MLSATGRNAAGTAGSADVAERYRASISRYVRRLVHDPERADDLTQETFLRVHRRLDELRDRALEAWSYRIAPFHDAKIRLHRARTRVRAALSEGCDRSRRPGRARLRAQARRSRMYPLRALFRPIRSNTELGGEP
jgi:hypothetical protein